MKKNKQFYLGLDISKPFFDACLLIVNGESKQELPTQQFNNDKAGLKHFEQWLKKSGVSYDANTLVVIENTGIYHRLIWKFCSSKNLPIHIGNAAHIKWSLGITRGKSDEIDSQRLCTYGYRHRGELQSTAALNPVFLQLKDLMTNRTRLMNQMSGLKAYLNELEKVNDTSFAKMQQQCNKAVLEGFKKSMKAIDELIKKLVVKDPQLQTKYRLLRTVPGIGHWIALYLIVCTKNFTNGITGKQLACYAGVVPFEHSSGISIRGRNRVHKMANKDLKKLLHLGALSAIKYYKEFKIYYQRK
ncbi:MAG: IS110 family transposase, partial [Bacteroidota bacterium]